MGTEGSEAFFRDIAKTQIKGTASQRSTHQVRDGRWEDTLWINAMKRNLQSIQMQVKVGNARLRTLG